MPLIMFNAGKSRGSGILGRGGPLLAGDGCDASSYDGGGSNGVFWSVMSPIQLTELIWWIDSSLIPSRQI